MIPQGSSRNKDKQGTFTQENFPLKSFDNVYCRGNKKRLKMEVNERKKKFKRKIDKQMGKEDEELFLRKRVESSEIPARKIALG